MIFHSWTFCFFFLVVYALYLSLRHRWQNRLLLVASYWFYGYWDWRFLALILISTTTDYLCGLQIGSRQDGWQRKAFLMVSLTINLGLLAFFKYFFFLCENLALVLGWFQIHLPIPSWSIVLPVGISFYTFQTLSYTIDVYRKQVEPIRDFGDYALYVSYFPQLLAGPIERASNLLPQIQSPRTLSHERLTEGCFLIYWGLFKKIYIADNLGTLLAVYCQPQQLGHVAGDGALILLSGYAFLFQLYCDFSAYTDIARGLAFVMGFRLMENFRTPLLASNIQDVWARWHISLTTWVRDYVYYPLALHPIGRRYFNDKILIVFTFCLIGLWHGASWTFVLWGLFHGVLLALYAWFKPVLFRWFPRQNTISNRLAVLVSIVITFHVSVIGAVLFRAPSLGQLGWWVRDVFVDFGWSQSLTVLSLQIAAFVVPLMAYEIYERYGKDWAVPAVLRYAFLYGTFYLLAVYGSKTPSTYIYFQF